MLYSKISCLLASLFVLSKACSMHMAKSPDQTFTLINNYSPLCQEISSNPPNLCLKSTRTRLC